MTELLTATQMRTIERAAIESGEVTGLELMERAGAGVVEAIFEQWPEYQTAPQSASVLCGPGNNGGDGFVVARLLAAKGWTVKAFLYGEVEKLPPDARTNYEIWSAVNTVEELTERGFRKLPYTLYIDALFGTGLTRPLEGAARQVISLLAGRNGDDYSDAIVSIDAPSGLCLDSGVVLQAPPLDLGMPALESSDQQSRGYTAFQEKFAALTVAFDSPKIGHFIAAGPACCGRLVVKDIGLENWRCFKPRNADQPRFVMTKNGPVGLLRPAKVRLTGQAPLVQDLRNKTSLGWSADVWLDKRSGAHKFSHGHALVLSGGHGKTGAARLAARGALRIGAGLVTLASPRSAMYENAAHLTAIMLKQIDGAHGVSELLEDNRINALCLGPGLGRGMDTQAVVIAALKGRRPTVLDADALTRFERNPQVLFDLLHDACVLTPHGGEFAKLFPDLAEKLAAPATTGPAYSKVDATCEAAARAGCLVLYKGADTVIAAPDGRCSVNAAQYERAAPWLATAGSGDVLAGFITGLLARGLSPMQAAETGARLHVDAALEFGPGLIAEDLPEQLPALFRRLKT